MVRFGVKDTEMGDLTATALSAGVEKVWQTSQAWIAKQEEEVIATFEAERLRREAAASSDRGRHPLEDETILKVLGKETLEEQKAAALETLAVAKTVQQPVWQEISGLHRPEYAMSPGERAGRIRKLLRAVERVARVELKNEDQRCGGDWRGLRALVDEDGKEDGRCFAWDPLRSICYYFGIAKTKLGAYAWEIWGLSAPQIVDRVKCEAVRGKLRAEIKAFVSAYYKEHPEAEVEDVWAALRNSRKGVGHRTSLAARLGFSSYARYFRACVLCYGIEPGELEREIFEEILTEPGAVVKQECESVVDGEGQGENCEARVGMGSD